MRLRDRVSEQELEAIMEEGRKIRPAPDVVRARLLARARAAVAAAEASPPLPATMAIPPSPHGRRIAAAAAVILALAAAGAVAALHAPRAPEPAPTVRRSPEAPAVRASVPPIPTEEPPSVGPSSSRPGHPHRTTSPQESYAAELQLLQRAQAQYTRQDFQDALVLIAEHAHQFPNGRLAEEREALRVKSLAGAGRGDEARRALAAFAKHFPRSALLPRLRETARSAQD
jgi:hypothetical protein